MGLALDPFGLVAAEFAKLHKHLLAPLGVPAQPAVLASQDATERLRNFVDRRAGRFTGR